MKGIRKGLIGILAGIWSIFGVVDNANATPGRLDVSNIFKLPYDKGYCKLVQAPGANELEDSYDSNYNPMFTPFSGGISSKIISKVRGHLLEEMDLDVRPEESLNLFYLEASIIAQGVQKGDLIYMESPNVLWFDMARAQSHGWDFGNKMITLQQYNSNEPNIAYPVYDIRKEIVFGQDVGAGYNFGIIPLPDLNGYYGSEIPYAFFKVGFDRNLADLNYDGKVDMLDLAILGAQFGRTGNSLADIAISDPNNGIYLSPNTTPYFDGVVDLADLVKFSESWGYGWNTKPAPSLPWEPAQQDLIIPKAEFGE